MNFTNLLFVLVLFSTVYVSTFSSLWLCNKKEQEIQKKWKSLNESRFISKSFINTCNGIGFESLDQWEETCRRLYHLDSITWEIPKDSIYCGKWSSESSEGEIYSHLEQQEQGQRLWKN